MRRVRSTMLIGLLALSGAAICAAVEPPPEATIYPAVRPGQPLSFPADHGAHPDYRTEWWYITGWLEDGAGNERGFQVTFFRVRTGIGEDNPSRFAPRQLILAHAAVADPATGHLLHAERVARAFDPLAGAAVGHTQAWIGTWRLEGEDQGAAAGDRYRARVQAEAFGFDLHFEAPGTPVLNGAQGFSQKAPDPVNASYYYSRPQLAVSGTLQLGATSHTVRGRAWLDHEWSSELLPAPASGWDWIGINLHDGGALMAFQMRGHDGMPLWTAATLTSAQGTTTVPPRTRIRFVPQRRWRSPRTGVEYPVEWRLEIGDRRLQLRPLLDDQELDARPSTGVLYWEGAVRVFEDAEEDNGEGKGESGRDNGRDTGREIGRGYLEMTGYGGRPPL